MILRSYLIIFKVNHRRSTMPFQAADDELARMEAVNLLRANDAATGELVKPDAKNPKEFHSLGMVQA